MQTRYDKEFKQNIINLYKQGESAAQLAREYGIGYSTVHKWIQGQAKTQSGKSPDEIKAMEKRLASLSEENEILKKPWASLRRSNQYLWLHSPRKPSPSGNQDVSNPRCFQSSVLSLSIPKPSKRRAEDADLKQRILRIFAEFKQRYGVMKIHHELNLELQPLQLRCSPRRISRLMKELDIHSVTVNKWKAASASKPKVEQRPNLLKQDFSTTGLNQKWTADMTYIQTKRNGWCYLSTIMDLHSRRIIGYSFSKKMATDLVLKTLESAVKNRTITGDLIIHTDLGSQYTSDDYNQRLTELHIRHSYSRKGCPYDNAPMESFHASLKKECVYPVPVFEDYETAAAVLFEYVHAFYNRKRIHSSLGY